MIKRSFGRLSGKVRGGIEELGGSVKVAGTVRKRVLCLAVQFTAWRVSQVVRASQY
jgi:hypothetical protein